MSESLRQRKQEKKKKEILQVAASIFAEKGYEKTTMEDVASQLLMTKGSMYYYFSNKEEMLFESQMLILEPSIEKISNIKASSLPPVEKITQLFEEFVLFEISEKTAFSLAGKLEQIYSEEHFQKIVQKRDEYNQIFDSLLQEGIENNEFFNINVKMARMLLLGALNSIQSWYKPSGKMTPKEIAEMSADYLTRMLIFNPVKQ